MTERKTDNRTRSRAGFTLGETLVTILILLLVSSGVVSGMRFGVEQYHRSMMLSEAKVLCSTLSSVIRSELSDTGSIRLTGSADGEGFREVESFFSPRYAIKEDDPTSLVSVTVSKGAGAAMSEAEDGYGELLLGTVNSTTKKAAGRLLLSSAAYTTYQLRANASIRYNAAQNLFSVTLRIRTHDGDEDLIVSSFDVLPLNDPTVQP